MSNILILGGTTEASALAAALAERGMHAVLSYAGRTDKPRAQPVPVRVGGFGGMAGLARHLREEGVTHLVDATHPFAATMSEHAVAAAREAGVKHIMLTRPPWIAAEGDRWTHVPDLAGAVATLAGARRNVMLALGRMHVDAFAAQPQHHYLLRFVDMPAAAPGLPDHALVIDRGPFTVEGDMQLMRAHGIDCVVSKNAGGSGAQAKLVAARTLGLPVVMIGRPACPAALVTHEVAGVLQWLGHAAERGV
ncbi:cobalt-precorrin-6x reductase [Sphingobium indicum IP26]|uniref:Cobalt-precorrin-6X reductase n=1 Tax=Sphingobium indicum F2 TaxID=1450518 RepID=A0A8E0WV15_9SPHN|nr:MULTISPECIES: cobalt-precorrin-6A reductase [Sphingobium]EPR17986.1 cobalt-precorrin-6x reductase [Sphingobium indicum IP26]EQB03114.1 cobalt-precorrin-6x reductase [Sphingobium sp. HDIP04]KER37930.1 cobalt-precorrin-6X reductase [Sphingobium indicum F2]